MPGKVGDEVWHRFRLPVSFSEKARPLLLPGEEVGEVEAQQMRRQSQQECLGAVNRVGCGKYVKKGPND